MIPKFRAWHKKHGMCSVESINFQSSLIGLIDEHGSDYECKLYDTELMQFIGLCDSSKKEIYEGDILLLKNYLQHLDMENMEMRELDLVGVVDYSPPDFFVKKDGHYGVRWEEFEKSIVIGNIWQSPELLSEVE